MVALGGRLAKVRLPVVTPRLSLRLPQLSDVPLFLRYVNDPRVYRPLVSRRKRYRRSEEVAFVRSARRAASKGERLNLAITLRTDATLIGGIGLEVPDWENGRGFVGYWLAPQHWHRGYGSEAASAVCRIAFRQLMLHRIDALVFEFNPRSMNLLERLGFRREGLRREIVFRDDRWYNEVAFGLLSREFRPYRYEPR